MKAYEHESGLCLGRLNIRRPEDDRMWVDDQEEENVVFLHQWRRKVKCLKYEPPRALPQPNKMEKALLGREDNEWHC